jgi:hypothetical protein
MPIRRSSAFVVCLFLVLLASAAHADLVQFGETRVLAFEDGSNANLLIAQRTTHSQAGTLRSLSFYVLYPAGKLRLGLYDATGPGGGPGTKKAETAEFTPVHGWNTASVLVPVTLPAGPYWLAYLTNDNRLGFFIANTTGLAKYYGFRYGQMPAKFATSTSTCDPCHWSFYASVETDPAVPPPPPPPSGDTQGPAGTIAINSGAAATNARNVTLTLSATDPGGVTQMRFSTNGSSFSAPEAYVPTKAWTLTAGTGAKTVYVQFSDALGNWSSSVSATIVYDTTVPTIQTPTVANVTDTTATITWMTTEPASSQVEYALMTASSSTLTPVDTALVTSRAVQLTGLEPQKTYGYRVRSRDAAGNERISGVGMFTTLAGPVDASPPTMPTNLVAKAVSAVGIDLSWTPSSDDVRVEGYKIFRNGTQVATTPTAAYSDSKLAPSTGYMYTASAYDAAGNESPRSEPASATTLVDGTAPTVSITAPANDASVSGSLTITALAGDDIGVASVTFQVDGSVIGAEDTTFPYSAVLDTTSLSNGSHVLTATARDTSGNTTTSASVAINVDNTTPAPGTPTMIQHVSTASNYDVSEPGNHFKLHLADPAGANNTVILGISYIDAPNRTVAINDDRGNTWVAGPMAVNHGIVSRIYYVNGVAAGTRDITVSFDRTLVGFQAVVSEFYNVRLTGTTDGASSNASSVNPTITAGPLVTTAGGNLIYNYVYSNNFGGAINGITAGPGFTLLSADRLRASAAQYQIQPEAGAINPTMTVASSGSMNSVAVAFQGASVGTPPRPGIRVVRVYHGLLLRAQATLQFPSSGNLLVFASTHGTLNSNITAITSAPANTWTKVAVPPVQATDPQFFYVADAVTSPDLTWSLTMSLPWLQFVIYDVTGAAASPLDVAAKTEGTNVDNSDILNAPPISPTTANGLIIAALPMGHGPPVGSVGADIYFDSVTYPGEPDGSTFESSDGYAHTYNAQPGPMSFGWKALSLELPSWWEGLAVAFKGIQP